MLFRILLHDIKAISNSFFVVLIILAIIVIPSIYAWLNIYAINDPYVNTGNLPVAVASRDAGIRQTDGSVVNEANKIETELKKNDNIGWEFPGTAEEAIEGVRSGKYYAAVIFEDNFTYNMHNLKEALASEEPSLTYYTNTKKNGVASKITDSAAEDLLEKINTKYLEAVFDTIFEDTNELSEELDGDEAVDEALKQLTETRDALHDFNLAITQINSSSSGIQSSLNSAEKNLDRARANGKSDLSKAEKSIKEAKKTLKALSKDLKGELADLKSAIAELDQIMEKIENATDEEEIRKLAEKARALAEKILTILKEIRSLIPETSQSSAARIVCDTIDIMILQTEEIIELIDEDPVANVKALADAVRSLSNIGSSDLAPAIENLLSDFQRAIRIAKPLLAATDGMLDGIDPVLDSAGDTVGSMDVTFGRIQVVLTSLEKQLDDVIAQVESADKKDRLDLLTKLMGGDPDKYSDFFASLVGVRKHEIYPVGSYGAAMAPFFTILALWVGGVMLVSLLQTSVDRRKFPQITESQSFFGRYLIFFLIGQMQAVVVVVGERLLLHIDPVHPWLMWISAAFASMVFVMLIYALTLSFGIIGKGVVVLVMVLQIAGSSGSYPIEILPAIFGKIYKFFPFPYGINAMREALCGTYGNDFALYLGKLLIFGVIGVVIGLLVRRPFVGVTKFVEEKLEETEVL